MMIDLLGLRKHASCEVKDAFWVFVHEMTRLSQMRELYQRVHDKPKVKLKFYKNLSRIRHFNFEELEALLVANKQPKNVPAGTLFVATSSYSSWMMIVEMLIDFVRLNKPKAKIVRERDD